MNSDSSVTIKLNLKSHEQQLIDQAASVLGLSRNEFLIEAAMNYCKETLSDKQVFLVTANQWKQFQDALVAKPKVNEKLRKVLSTQSPWD